MSLEKIADILKVDEVKLNHGPKGVAVHVCINKSWFSTAIDNDKLGDRRLEVIAEHLAFLADAHIPRARDLRKSQADAATAAALQAERETQLRRGQGWGRDWFDKPYDGPLRQVVKSEPPPAVFEPPVEPAPEGPAAEAMPSRFHAIMAELRCL